MYVHLYLYAVREISDALVPMEEYLESEDVIRIIRQYKVDEDMYWEGIDKVERYRYKVRNHPKMGGLTIKTVNKKKKKMCRKIV